EALPRNTPHVREKMPRRFQRLPRGLLVPVARFVEQNFPGQQKGPIGEAAAAVRTHARRVQMDDLPRYAAQFGGFTTAQLPEVCTPELTAAGHDAAQALFTRLLEAGTAPDELGRLLELDIHT